MIYKIVYKCYFLFVLSGILPVLAPEACCQLQPGTRSSEAGVKAIKTLNDYHLSVKNNNYKKLINLSALIPSITVDLRYATTDNFTGVALYPASTRTAWLRKAPAGAIQKVQQELLKQGLTLKIFDAYRPFSVTVKFWDLIGDERYVARPTKGSGHNRGLAIDLTIANLHDHKPLDMGTGFDNFSDTASHGFAGLPAVVVKHRQLLRGLMMRYGFQPLATEWWHYSWPDDQHYEVLDLPHSILVTDTAR